MAKTIGRAERGSRLQMQIAVNRRSEELSRRVVETFPELQDRGAAITWRSPLAPDYEEFRDAAFLSAVGLPHLGAELTRFWPLRGPVWDGLATIHWLR